MEQKRRDNFNAAASEPGGFLILAEKTAPPLKKTGSAKMAAERPLPGTRRKEEDADSLGPCALKGASSPKSAVPKSQSCRQGAYDQRK